MWIGHQWAELQLLKIEFSQSSHRSPKIEVNSEHGNGNGNSVGGKDRKALLFFFFFKGKACKCVSPLETFSPSLGKDWSCRAHPSAQQGGQSCVPKWTPCFFQGGDYSMGWSGHKAFMREKYWNWAFKEWEIQGNDTCESTETCFLEHTSWELPFIYERRKRIQIYQKEDKWKCSTEA